MADLQAIKASIERILLDPTYHAPLTLLKSLRNGLVYGTKVRLPHALVMVVLFRTGSARDKARQVLRATYQHARNLALFAFIYKATCLALRSVLGHEAGAEPFAAGLVGGYLIFGRTTGKRKQSSVNQQICIYVFARVVLGLAKLGFGPEGNTQTLAVAEGTAEKEEEDKLDRKGGQEDIKAVVRRWAWPAFAALSWAGAMAMFRYYPDMLQPSLKSSMQYIFADSDSWDSFRTLVVYNTLTPVNESITTTEGIPTD